MTQQLSFPEPTTAGDRNYQSQECDDCGASLILPGWLCYDCARDRGLR